jgi:AraC-like DNA-binding protein
MTVRKELKQKAHQLTEMIHATYEALDAEIAATELRGDKPQTFMSGSIPHEDAFLVGLLVREAIADDANATRIGELSYTPGAGIRDQMMTSLATATLLALERPEHASCVFVDHVTLAVATHVARVFGGMRVVTRPNHGGLAPWQERRAKDLLAANLDCNISLKEVARECDLSISHFARAFRQSTGVPPHRWLVMHRVETAKAMLKDPSHLLSEIGLSCGFADQSHFTRPSQASSAKAPAPGAACIFYDEEERVGVRIDPSKLRGALCY